MIKPGVKFKKWSGRFALFMVTWFFISFAISLFTYQNVGGNGIITILPVTGDGQTVLVHTDFGNFTTTLPHNWVCPDNTSVRIQQIFSHYYLLWPLVHFDSVYLRLDPAYTPRGCVT